MRMCYVCDLPISRGEPRKLVDDLMIHEYCSPEGGQTCNTRDCMWRWTDHAGACV